MRSSSAIRCRYWPRQARLLFRHLRYGWRGAPARTRELESLFLAVNAWLRACEVDHWLAYGTLLGWFRERRLLAHDTDVDFGAPIEAYEVLRHAASRLPAGFILRDSSHRHLGPKLYVSRHDWEADIYFYRAEAGQLQSTERTRNPGEAAPFPREFVFPLQTVTMLGAEARVPAQPELLLRHHYRYLGPDAVRDPVTRYFRPRQATASTADTGRLS